jgi:hypothetical protein
MLATLVALLAVARAANSLTERQNSLSSFIRQERSIALNGAINNIGGSGSELVPGAFPGIVVAAPSTFNPHYFYTWTRDSALTFTMLIDELIMGNTSVQCLIDDYVRAQAVLQTIANPSGTLHPAGLGLGEPKFYTNESRFNGDWGHPQRDGPALRAVALMDYCSYLLDNGQMSMVKNMIWPIVLTDLKYVGQYWNQTGYDLREEVRVPVHQLGPRMSSRPSNFGQPGVADIQLGSRFFVLHHQQPTSCINPRNASSQAPWRDLQSMRTSASSPLLPVQQLLEQYRRISHSVCQCQ